MKQVSKDYFINEYNSISSFCHENNEPVCVEKELIVIPCNYFENRDANLKIKEALILSRMERNNGGEYYTLEELKEAIDKIFN